MEEENEVEVQYIYRTYLQYSTYLQIIPKATLYYRNYLLKKTFFNSMSYLLYIYTCTLLA